MSTGCAGESSHSALVIVPNEWPLSGTLAGVPHAVFPNPIDWPTEAISTPRLYVSGAGKESSLTVGLGGADVPSVGGEGTCEYEGSSSDDKSGESTRVGVVRAETKAVEGMVDDSVGAPASGEAGADGTLRAASSALILDSPPMGRLVLLR